MVRKFALINGNGERYDLNDKLNFLLEPMGLGFEKKSIFRGVGSRYVRLSTSIKQSVIEGDLYFTSKDPYEDYFNFIKFSSIEPLILEYSPKENNVYYRDVELTKIVKTEINKYGVLKTPVDFTCLSPFYKKTVLKYSPEESVSEVDGWVWGIEWGIRFSNYKNMTFELYSDVTNESPTKMIFHGPLKNPTWSHYINGKLITTGKLKYDVLEGHRLVINNSDNELEMYIIDGNGMFIKDVYDSSDFSTKRFVNISKGNNIIHVTDDDHNDNKLELEVLLYYDTV